MNEYDELAVTDFALSWQVDTLDITGQLARRIDKQTPIEQLLNEVLAELRLVRSNIADLRHENESLQLELARLRADLTTRRPARISPFSPSENYARLSSN